MKTAVLCFSPQGAALAKNYFSHFDLYGKDFHRSVKKENFGALFSSYDRLIFFGATGIAVRYIAPWVEDKGKDPAVVVIDPLGRYVIPILSGHLGGANALAVELAKMLGAEAILTTASDSLGFEAMDIFAQRADYAFDDRKAMKNIAAAMVAGKTIRWFSEEALKPDYAFIQPVDHWEAADVVDGVVVSRKNVDVKYALRLVPRRIHVGVGSRKGTDGVDLVALIKSVLEELDRHPLSISAIHTIDVKKDEPSIVYASETLKVPLRIHRAESLRKYEGRCTGSEFVKATVGVSGVSCPAALMGAEHILAEKVRSHGLTVTVTEE